MDEIKETSCSTESKKCCTKGIIILVICCLVSFFIGFYSGNKMSNKSNRRPTINRPFTSARTRLPNRIANRPTMQRPPAQRINRPNIPKTITPRTNIPPQNIQEKNRSNIQKKSNIGNTTTSKSKK